MKKIILFIFLPWCVLAQDQNLFLPCSEKFTIIDNLYTTSINSIKSASFRYTVSDMDLEQIKTYYQQLLVPRNFVKDIDQVTSGQKQTMYHLRYTEENDHVDILILTSHPSEFDITVTKTENKLLFNKEYFSLNSKKDNQGFDLRDVPRPKESIRMVSLLNTAQNDKEICNLIYKSGLSQKQLAVFYMRAMKRYQWQASSVQDFYQGQEGYWMMFRKNKKQCLISILYIDEYKSNAALIYYILLK